MTATTIERNDLDGVGGWLLLLVIGLTVLGPIYSAGSMIGELSTAEAANQSLRDLPLWAAIKRDLWIGTFVSIALSMTAGVLLAVSRTKRTPWIAAALMWLAGPVAGVAAQFVVNLHVPTAAGPAIAEMVRACIVAFVWTLYLAFSRRVRRTYRIQ